MNCMRIALGVACALGLTIGTAYANDQWQDRSHQSIRSAIGACHKLPVSERGTCKVEAQMHQDMLDVSAAARPPLSSAYVIPDRTAFNKETSRYKTLASECHRAPVSERNSCLDEASLGLARPAQLPNLA